MSTLEKLVSWVFSIAVLCALSVAIVHTAGWTVLILFGLICLLGKTIELTLREIADLKRKVV